MGIDNYRELYNDDILYALDRLKPSYKRAFLLQQAGYKLKEIVDIEYANGTLKAKNIDTIKSRLFLARQTLKEVLTRDGERRKEISDEEAALKHALFDKYVMPYTRMIYKLVMDYSFNPRNIRDNYYDVLTK